MELDLRLVQFHHDDGSIEWIGTYTAFSGRDIQSEIMRTRDFRCFELVPMSGAAARDKGMALFPRKVGGGYAMIGRQDGENLYLIRSDKLTRWDEGKLLLKPKRSAEHTSELQSLMRTSYAVFCLKKNNKLKQAIIYIKNNTNKISSSQELTNRYKYKSTQKSREYKYNP